MTGVVIVVVVFLALAGMIGRLAWAQSHAEGFNRQQAMRELRERKAARRQQGPELHP